MNQTLGQFGETWAAAHLTRRGYQVIDRNVRYRGGEIDLVALEGGELVFVEVKCRRSQRYGTPQDSITPSRFARLAGAISRYLQTHDGQPESYRIDVLAITVGTDGRVSCYELLRGVEAPAW